MTFYEFIKTQIPNKSQITKLKTQTNFQNITDQIKSAVSEKIVAKQSSVWIIGDWNLDIALRLGSGW
jgi:hypothetical protein